MARYTTTIPTQRSPERLARSIATFLTDKGFKLIDPDENLWKLGTGWFLAPQFIRFKATPEKLWLEAWLKFSLLPGVFVGEFGIDGVFMLIPKKMLRASVEEIERMAQ